MMCDEGVVNIGDMDVDVQDKCGEPNTQNMNEWVYNFGPDEPVYTVIFKDGKVVRIETAAGTDYVFLDAQPFKFEQGNIRFEGTAGCIQLRGPIFKGSPESIIEGERDSPYLILLPGGN